MSACALCGAAHYGTPGRCPYVDRGVIPGWVEPERVQLMRAAIQQAYAAGKVRPDGAQVHVTRIIEPEVGKPPRHYWWTCSCGDEGGPHDSYNEAWDATVAHEPRATPLGAIAEDVTRLGPSQHVRGSWRGFFALHRGEDLPVIADALRELRPPLAVEIGTAAGGFAAFLADTLAEWGGRVLTVDVKKDSVPPDEGFSWPAIDRLLATTPNLEFLEADACDSVTQIVLAEWLSHPGVFLYIDGGDKERELRCLVPLLSTRQAAYGCHDWGSEVDPDVADAVATENRFERFRWAEFEALAHPGYPISMTRLWVRG